MTQNLSKFKAKLHIPCIALLSSLWALNLGGAKAQDFLNYTPEEFNQQAKICAFKSDATIESCREWLKARAEMYCGNNTIGWGNCFAMLIQHGPQISHLKSRVEALRQQMFDFERRDARACKINGNCRPSMWAQSFQNAETMLGCIEKNKNLQNYSQIEEACYVPDYFKKHYGM